ncbi:MAG: PIN domain-containing protein [Gemmatimonadetes bacterium]|nr:PIN domain-containing protein [Gemmatimonadota bacterium]
MTGPVFVDTNVFVYLHDDSELKKKTRADEWISLLVRGRSGRVSFQVLQELYSTLTSKRRLNVDVAEARIIVRELAVWQPVAVDLAMLNRAWVLQDRFPLSWWDALIIAAAQTCECKVLLTEDLQGGQEFGAVQVVNPFASPDRTPEEILEALAS